MSTSISAGIGDLPCFTKFQLFPCFPCFLFLIQLKIFVIVGNFLAEFMCSYHVARKNGTASECVLCSVLLHSITEEEQCKNFSAMNPVTTESVGEGQKKAITCVPIINHTLKSEVAFMLHLQLCSARYTALHTNKKLLCNIPCCFKKASGKLFCASQIDICVVSEKNWRTKVTS